mgnify:CR=1 FL=1
MPVYTATQRYRSSLGQFAEGDQVELEEDFAAHINRDSPGTLVLTVDEPVEAEEDEAEEGAESRQLDAPPSDRMVKNARRRDRRGDPGDQGPITKDDHKAVKDQVD